MKTHAGSMHAVLVSVSPGEPCLVDSVGQVLLVSSIIPECNLQSLFPLLSGFPQSPRDQMESSNLDTLST